MRSYVLTSEGPRVVAHDVPSIRNSDVLVRVRACALNRAECVAFSFSNNEFSATVGILEVNYQPLEHIAQVNTCSQNAAKIERVFSESCMAN